MNQDDRSDEPGSARRTFPRAARIGHRWAPRGACVTALLSMLLAGCDRGDHANTYAPPPPPEVIVSNPVSREVTTYLEYTGSVEASERVELRARVQGFLLTIGFQPGQRVKTGDLMFVIDKREYEASLARARAVLASAEATLKLAQTTLERAQDAFRQGGTSELEVREKEAARDEAKAALDLAKASLRHAELDLEYCEIRAPIDGRIGRNLVDIGNLVGRGESTLLAEIVRSTPAFVSVDVSESDVLAIRRERIGSGHDSEPGQTAPGQWRPCELALASDHDFSTPGRVDYVDPAVNAETGTLRVRTRYENEDEGLLPGLFARVRFPMTTRQALLVPESALLSDQQGRYAMVVNDKDEVEKRRVGIGALDGTNRIVEEGLAPNDRVIVLGVLKARPGSKVSPKVQREGAAAGR